ncbi:hypothetical protein [Jiella sonneratiae]|uniref:Uncharacterized protein n=1 Tax=Jiella sonneratiae TaxID=2816856 RepID=A0ABS3J6R7_9HYPH|nr:hypothetical protein [Jiella sonneratiae]MBO0905342.1 hypothetical protein [Jiella sonneratiae]
MLLTTAIGLSGASDAGARELPRQVKAHIAEIGSSCDGGYSTKGAVRTADFNGDGRTDYLVDEGAIICRGQTMSGFCGATGFCSFTVFVTSGKGFTKRDFLARGYEISGRRLIVDGKPYRWAGKRFVPR